MQSDERTQMNKKLYVGNLGDGYTNRSRGFGFVEMTTVEQAQEAISKLNEQELAGRQIKVAEAHPTRRNRRPSRDDRW
ncbi:MAG: hypothetical protein AMJ93_15145 [Anaerolineae bacterium SM23_84]|nr:MAG: hypothetical protein AMJ93_15145 [Anaerolineae bacterium SM23_84]